jgi:hypothetical protein
VRVLVGARSSAGANPRYDRPLRSDAIRRAGTLASDDATYYVWAPSEDPVFFGSLKAAAQLFFAPALPVPDPRRARWIFAYERAGLPAGTHATRTILVGNGIRLVKVSH